MKDKYVVTFEFDNEEAAQGFLGYMCDGGGEYPIVAGDVELSDTVQIVEFDYHSLNEGKFGPRVHVRSEPIE